MQTPYTEELTERCLRYLQAGFPVHLRGPSGTGKTTLALNVAKQLGRPVVLIYGDDEFKTSDLVGGSYGFRRKLVIDNFVHSVYKTEEILEPEWVDGRLITACNYGYTLVYDEFTRSKPEANNVFLSVLEEKVLELPVSLSNERYLKVHPNFRAIFTSNPEEYAGVHHAQDALKDRMITVELGHFDPETEIAITMARSGVSPEDARAIVRLVRRVRERFAEGYSISVRTCIMIAKVIKLSNAQARPDDPVFRRACLDVLGAAGMDSKHPVELKGIVQDSLVAFSKQMS